MTGRSDVFAALRRELVSRYGARQVFVFGPQGEPFWALREPVEQPELTLLDLALRMIEELEASRPRPFSAWDAARGLLVGALDEVHDLYFVVLCGTEAQSAEARVAIARAAFIPYLDALRHEMFTREIA